MQITLCILFSYFLGIVVGVFYLCWIPFMIAVVLSAFSETLVTPVVVLVISTIVYSNSAINPVLYGYLNRDFRLAYKRLASRISCPYTGGLHGPHERSYDVSELSARHTPPQHVQGAYYLTDKQQTPILIRIKICQTIKLRPNLFSPVHLVSDG